MRFYALLLLLLLLLLLQVDRALLVQYKAAAETGTAAPCGFVAATACPAWRAVTQQHKVAREVYMQQQQQQEGEVFFWLGGYCNPIKAQKAVRLQEDLGV